ncbi:MAG TPA: PAS domain S-box protein, partial [Hanamia sp.]|nr:PAS domain S-box protein [Hanamia sp.]
LGQLGFDNSSLANIVFTLSSGNIIMVNKAASKLFGYSKKLLLTKNRIDIFDITESNFKKLVKQQTVAEKPSIILNGIKKDGQLFPCEINYAVFKNDNGVEKAIISIADKSQSILDQKNIDTKNQKIVADNIVIAKSKQKIIDTKNEKIVSDNIILSKKNQKNINIKNEKIVADNIVIAKSKQKSIDTKNQKIVAENIVIAKSKQKRIDTRRQKIVDNNILLALKKCEDEKLKYENIGIKKLLTEVEEHFSIMFNLSSDILFDSDLLADKVMVNDAYEKEFGYKRKKNRMSSEDWLIHIHPDDKEEFMKEYHRVLKSKIINWKNGYRFLRRDGSVANVLISRIILRNSDGNAYRVIGSVHDISKQKVLEESLEREIKLKEMQITEAAEDAKDTERSDIGKELHDNVNQLLVASKLYLEMAKYGGKDSEMYLSRSSEYTLTAIEEIRKLGKGLTTNAIKDLGLCAAIENIRHDTMEVNAVKIVFKVEDFIENSVNDEFKLNIYRIIQEQLNNILKHAKATKVVIKLLQNKKFVKLIISDNGIGFDTGKKMNGIGIANIKSRAASYNGTADFISQPGSGCFLTVIFSASDKLLRRA